MLNKIITLVFLSASSLLLIHSCDTTEPPNNKALTLTLEDVSCTEAWINLETDNITLPQNVGLFLNDTLQYNINLTKRDTLLYVDSLFPSRQYTLQVKENKSAVPSNKVILNTMDTTSHNFTWETFSFGGGGNSILRDVAIINENDIWAVGEIHTEETDQFDSNGVWVQPYNAVHWDGNSWELKRIIVNFRGNNTFIPLEGIFALASDDIWLVGSLPIHGNGKNWKIYDVREMTNTDLSLTKAWGSSSNNMYFVGRGGSIAHYDGSRWEKIESGTELRFHDIYGNRGKTYCIAAELFTGINSELYEIKNNSAILVDGTNIGLSSRSVYPIGEKLYVFGYYRLVRTEGKIAWEQISEPVNFDGFSKIRGFGYNDIIAVGSFGKIYHYNGMNWKLQRIGEDLNNLIDFSSVAIQKNIICTVGQTGNSSFIVMGRR